MKDTKEEEVGGKTPPVDRMITIVQHSIATVKLVRNIRCWRNM